MMKEIRTFIAIKIQPGERLQKQLLRFKEQFKDDKISWVNLENFHLTLRFIGNTNKEQLYELVDRLEELATKIKSFSIEIEGTGYFRNKKQPRVLFVKIKETEELVTLANQIEESVVASGFHQELKAFRPHLTLGRIKHLQSRTRFCSILDEMPKKKYQTIEVKEFVIYKSTLYPEGPVYEPIRKFKLI